MKKEAILLLLAGAVFGIVVGFIIAIEFGTALGFILTREHYEKKLATGGTQSDPTRGGAAGQPPETSGAGGPPPGFDPNQHTAQIAQFMELARDPKNLQAKITLGNIYYDKGSFDQAVPWYEEALKLDEKNTDVMVDLGVCYRNLDRPDEALALFDRALSLDKTKKQALYNKVIVYAFDKKDDKKRNENLKRLKEFYPGDPMVVSLEEQLNIQP